MSGSAGDRLKRQPGEDWFDWLVRMETDAGSDDPVLAASTTEAFYLADGEEPE